MCVCMHTCVPLWGCVSPSLVQCISIIRHMPPCVMVSWAVGCCCDCHVYGGEGRGDFSCLDATNFLFMHGAHTHTHIMHVHVHTHTHTIDRFIIACQESAGFTFQQNGPIWRKNGLSPPLYLTLPNPTSSFPTHPAGMPAHSGESGTAPNSCFCHKLRVKFFAWAGEMGKERVILTVGITLCGS